MLITIPDDNLRERLWAAGGVRPSYIQEAKPECGLKWQNVRFWLKFLCVCCLVGGQRSAGSQSLTESWWEQWNPTDGRPRLRLQWADVSSWTELKAWSSRTDRRPTITQTHTEQTHINRFFIVRSCLSRKQFRECRGSVTMRPECESEELLWVCSHCEQLILNWPVKSGSCSSRSPQSRFSDVLTNPPAWFLLSGW